MPRTVGCWGHINSTVYFNFVFKIYDNLVANVSNKLFLKFKVLKYIKYRLFYNLKSNVQKNAK